MYLNLNCNEKDIYRYMYDNCFSGLGTPTYDSFFGVVNRDIFLSNVTCTEKSKEFQDCSHAGWGVLGPDCTLQTTAGVMCLGEQSEYISE